MMKISKQKIKMNRNSMLRCLITKAQLRSEARPPFPEAEG
jgi:hypothetical protein